MKINYFSAGKSFGLLIALLFCWTPFASTNKVSSISFPHASEPYLFSETIDEVREALRTTKELSGNNTFKLGMMLYAQSNYVQSAEAFIKAANLGSLEANFAASVCYLQGIGVSPDSEKMIHYLDAAARYPSANACRLMASITPVRYLQYFHLRNAVFGGDLQSIAQLREDSASMTAEEHSAAFGSATANPKIFKGLRSFLPLMQLNKEAKQLLSERAIQQSTELKLRSSGLKVVSTASAMTPSSLLKNRSLKSGSRFTS